MSFTKTIIALFMLLLSACASTQKMKDSPTCRVWRDVPVLGPDSVAVNQAQAIQRGRCLIMGLWLCSEKKAFYRSHDEAIVVDRGGLQGEIAVARLADGVMTYARTPGVLAHPIPIDLGSGKLQSKVTVAGFDRIREVEFNKRCSSEDVAVGAALLLSQ